MSRIKLLPENLINRIAAGEVVERPASILKELLENSLDAGASHLDIDIQGGGKKLIRVQDNGCGMDKEELFLCLERHATSKIGPDSDLLRISTLGFRGEALPSISAVSKLSITSALKDTTEGHRIRIEGGRILGLEPAPSNHGTTVEVRDIFYNIPARRKFLKTEATEQAHIVDIVQRYALSRSNLGIRLMDGQKEILAIDEQNDLAARVAKIIGRDTALDLRPFTYEKDDLKIHGHLGGPENSSRTSTMLFLYVLGRPVRDRLLARAVSQGYGRMLPQGRWPAGLIFVELDPERVDVNVHPAKTEVRFREPGEIFEALSSIVTSTVGTPIHSAGNPSFSLPKKYSPIIGQSLPHDFSPVKPSDSPIYTHKNFTEPKNIRPAFMGQPQKQGEPEPILSRPPWLETKEENPAENQAIHHISQSLPQEKPKTLRELAPVPENENFFNSGEPLANSEIIPLAQLNQSYILAQGDAGLYIIDQHAAHERIIFNRLKKILSQNGLPTQMLLFPDTLELSPYQALAAKELEGPLRHLGFDLSHFGGQTFVLKGIPAILEDVDPKEPLLEILSSAQSHLKALDGGGLEQIVDNLTDTWLDSLACRAALKAGYKMSFPEMERLIRDLTEADSGGYCPHGRPSIILTSYHELEKRFKRS